MFSTEGSIVLRCHTDDTAAAAPASFIVKQAKAELFGYDPRSPEGPNAAHGLFNDWAAAQFLSAIPSDPPLAPVFYGGSREAGFILLEDLGDGEAPNTHDALHGTDPELAEQTLIEHAALIGQLHAATIGRAEEYQSIRAALGPAPTPEKLFQDPWSEARRLIAASEIDEAIRLYQASFAALGVRPQAGVADEIEFITAVVEQDPGPFLAYCKGDQNMAGDYIRCGAKPRLFDFDAGGFRHALIEGMPGRMTWGCMMRLPKRLLPRMESAYRARLAQGYAAVADDGVFHRAMVAAGGRWHALHVIHRLPDALASDRQRGPTTLRQQVLAWLEAFADLSEEYGQLPALGTSARDMAGRLHELWSNEVSSLPYYPAFHETGNSYS